MAAVFASVSGARCDCRRGFPERNAGGAEQPSRLVLSEPQVAAGSITTLAVRGTGGSPSRSRWALGRGGRARDEPRAIRVTFHE